MAVSANTVWELRSTATAGSVNGGGFVTGASGTDFSQQNAAQYNLTAVTSSGAGNTVLTASAAANMVGNIAHCISGTNFTAGWYEILSVSVGTSITFGTNISGTSITSGIGSNGVINIGGAISLNSGLDNSFFSALSAGNMVWVKSGNFTMGGTTTTANGTSTLPVYVQGYSTTRGDAPEIASGNQPVISTGANAFGAGSYGYFKYMTITGTPSSVSTISATGGYVYKCKFINTSTTAGRAAVSGSTATLVSCEMVSQNGVGVNVTGGIKVIGCYIHNCATGLSFATTATANISGCVIAKCSATGIDAGSSGSGFNLFSNNTILGYAAKLGNGIALAAAAVNDKFINNIISSWNVGINQTTAAQGSNVGLVNDFYNNTTDTTNYVKDATDLAVNPQFTDISEITGSTATTSGSVLTQTGANFAAVTDNVDYVYVASGTSVTVGTYLITSHTTTTLTVNNALGTAVAGDVVFYVPTGKNYAVGSNVIGVGTPSVYGPVTTTSTAVGAVYTPTSTGSGSSWYSGE